MRPATRAGEYQQLLAWVAGIAAWFGAMWIIDASDMLRQPDVQLALLVILPMFPAYWVYRRLHPRH